MLATIKLPSLWEIFGPALTNPETYRGLVTVLLVFAPFFMLAITALILRLALGGVLNLFVPQRQVSRRRRR